MSGMDDVTLLREQLGLECKAIDERGRLVRTSGDEPDDIPLAAIFRLRDQCVIAASNEVPDVLWERLQATHPLDAFTAPELIFGPLFEWRPEIAVRRLRSYIFETSVVPDDVVRLRREDASILHGMLHEG